MRNLFFKLKEGVSKDLTTLYLKKDGNLGGCPSATVRICVIPILYSVSLLEAPIMSPRYKFSRI
jgi:hypothetical protein